DRSITIGKGTEMVTSVYPGKSGVIAHYVYRPDIETHGAIAVENPVVVKKGDQLSNGKYISVPTIAELVQRAGGRTAVASAKTVGLLLDRRVGIGPAKNCTTLFAGSALPDGVLARIAAALGPFPSARLQRDRWTTKAVTDFVWKDGVPAFTALWLGEPDLTQHETAPGAPSALAASKASYATLAAALSGSDTQGRRN